MTVEFDYQSTLNGIVSDILRMKNILESDQEAALTEIGKTIKTEVQHLLPKSDELGSGYKHMKDDVKVTVNGKRQKTGVTGVTVHGGKLTAYKWHMLDDGTRNPDGSIHTRAIHFTDKAVQTAEPKVNQIIDNLQRRVVEA